MARDFQSTLFIPTVFHVSSSCLKEKVQFSEINKHSLPDKQALSILLRWILKMQGSQNHEPVLQIFLPYKISAIICLKTNKKKKKRENFIHFKKLMMSHVKCQQIAT